MKTLYSVMMLGLVVILGFFSFAFGEDKLLLTLEQQTIQGLPRYWSLTCKMTM